MADSVAIGTVGWGTRVAGWIISPIISRLLKKGFSYLGFRSSDKLKTLESKVLQLKLVLEAIEASPRSDRLEPWMKELRCAFYEAEDILDAIDYQQLKRRILSQTDHKSVGGNFRCRAKQVAGIMTDFKVSTVSRIRLKATLDTIENLIDEGYKLISLLKLPTSDENINNTPNNIVRSPTKTTLAAPVVFGRDRDLEKIRRMLRDTPVDDEVNSSRTKCYSVIGIHGIPGSGKTTLAQYVCEKEREDGYFNLVMWIHVSQNFSVNNGFVDMLDIASGGKRDQPGNVDMLRRKLEEELSGKRFFLVLDDVWHNKGVHEQLGQLLSPLKAGKRGSKILVTTRTADAARTLGAQYPVAIPDLDKEQFFSMFMHYALDGATISDHALLSEHECIGRKIAEKLGRSPLAARTVAGQLRRRQDINFWRRTLNHDLLNETMEALWWSYQQLEVHVRQCFAYCSMFPRRYALHRNELVHLWMAQGFVETTNGTEDMENTGHSYFDILLSTSFIQLKEKYGNTELFTIHDLLRELAARVTGSECFRIEKGMEGQIPRDVRHLFVDFYDKRVFAEHILNLNTLRTLFIMPYRTEGMAAEDLEGLIKSLNKLRVLCVNFTQVGKILFPACIGEMKHLRYLSVSGCMIRTILPPAFGSLYHLQKIDAPNCYFDSSSCKEMRNLVSLRHMNTMNWLEFPDIGKLKLLRTWPTFRVLKARGYEIQQLEHLDNLHDNLTILGLENIESKEEACQAKLFNKVHILSLVLDWNTGGQGSNLMFRNPNVLKDGSSRNVHRHEFGERRTCDQSPDRQEEILEALRPPSVITSLTIMNYSGSTYPSWLSGEQDNLENLQLLQFSNCNGSDAPSKINEPFVYLRTLIISGCNWYSLPGNMERLTSLEELIMHDCKNILSLPRLPLSLKNITLTGWNGSVAPSWISEFLVNLCNLEISHCSWNSLPENMECLTALQELTISNCENILSLPRLPGSLKELRLTSCNRSLTDSCQKDGHPNWQKIAHVTEKIIN